jgi:hypothetical protein
MNRDRLSRHLLIAFLLSLALYVVGYWFIEGRRVAHTPWVVIFQSNTNGDVEIEIREETLGIGPTKIHITSTNSAPAIARQQIVFDTPKPVPFPVPGGECIFQDTTFLPGTVVLDVIGVKIQLLPRVLTVESNEFAWKTNGVLMVSPGIVPDWFEPPNGGP